jgi:hypothetical protein
MTSTEVQSIRRTISLLCSLINEPHAVDSIPRSSPVAKFVREYLAHDPAADISCSEAWSFFCEVARSGELKPMRQSEFLRRLPAAMEATYGTKKSHSIRRNGRTVRGFKSVTIREHVLPSSVLGIARQSHVPVQLEQPSAVT